MLPCPYRERDVDILEREFRPLAGEIKQAIVRSLERLR
jgi:hypothetical protein